MDIPTYIKNSNQENYNELFNQTLRRGLSNQGWTVPTLSEDEIFSLAPSMPIGTLWFNTDISKLVVKTRDPDVIEVIFSEEAIVI